MLSTLDDENKLTRVYTCKILNILFINYKLTIDELHKMYAEMLKRLDDSCEDIRLIMIDAFKNLGTNKSKFMHTENISILGWKYHSSSFFE